MLTIARMLMAWLPLYSTTNYDNKLLIKEEMCECFEMEKMGVSENKEKEYLDELDGCFLYEMPCG